LYHHPAPIDYAYCSKLPQYGFNPHVIFKPTSIQHIESFPQDVVGYPPGPARHASCARGNANGFNASRHAVDAIVERAQALQTQGQTEAAIKECKAAIALDPTHLLAREMLAYVYQERGDAAQAYELFVQLHTMNPQNALYLANLGIASQGLNRLDKAIFWYQKAIETSPTYPVPYSNLANCLKLVDRLTDAEWHYKRAIELDDNFADARSNYGNLLKESERTDEAILQYQKALEIEPTHANAWSNLGGSYKDSARVVEAISAYRKALALRPHFPVAMANLVHCLTTVCDWPARDGMLKPLMDMLREKLRDDDYSHAIQPHHALVYPLSNESQIFIAKTFADGVTRMADSMVLAAGGAPQMRYSKWAHGERLRIGYMSSDFGNHPLSQLMQNFFGMHNQSQFHIFGFALSPNDGTNARKLIEAGIETFYDVHDKTTLEICNLIQTHQIHIMVDLNGYTKGSRTEVFALRPAPIQVQYMGYAGTMGASFIDYLISDHVTSPQDHFELYTEKIAQMPHSYFVNDHKQTYPPHFDSKELATRESLGLPTDKFVFACFNQLYKIDASIFHVWASILNRTANSVLWLLQFPPAGEAILRKTAEEKYGIKPERLIFTPVAFEKDEYMRFIACADLVLDTLQYNGHTSSCDVLWAGVPIVTLPLQHMASRVCASLLTALECPELICQTAEQYEEMAVRLGSPAGQQELMQLREKVINNRMSTPLFDTEQWTRDVERLFMHMARRYANGLPPDHISFFDLDAAHCQP
jgi:protein O-GlcNAc transferase